MTSKLVSVDSYVGKKIWERFRALARRKKIIIKKHFIFTDMAKWEQNNQEVISLVTCYSALCSASRSCFQREGNMNDWEDMLIFTLVTISAEPFKINSGLQ